jgi:hypothetical protein
MHLTRQAQVWHTRLAAVATTATPATSAVAVPNPDLNEEDLGFIDLIEIAEARFNDLTQINQRIATSTVLLGKKMNLRTAEMKESTGIDRSVAKSAIAKTAADMDEYTSQVEAEIPAFARHLDRGIDALIRATKLQFRFGGTTDGHRQAKESLGGIISMRKALSETEGQVQRFREIVAGLPPIASVLNTSKRRLVSVLDRLIEAFRTGQSLTREAEQMVDGSTDDTR